MANVKQTDHSDDPFAHNSLVRRAFLGLALLVLLGIVLELFVSANRDESVFSNPLVRAANLFVFFTIWTNILTGITSFFISRNKFQNSSWFWALHLAGLGGVAVTFIIHRLYLVGPLTGVAFISDTIIHVLVPIAAICFWLYFGPRGKINGKAVLMSTMLPNIWIAFTFLRGFLTDYYPYDFIDPAIESTSTIITNVISIYLLMYSIILAKWWIDRQYLKHLA